jgi:hypothetical protein
VDFPANCKKKTRVAARESAFFARASAREEGHTSALFAILHHEMRFFEENRAGSKFFTYFSGVIINPITLS